MRVAPILLLTLLTACGTPQPPLPPDDLATAAAEGRLVDVRRFLDEGADPDQPTLRRRPLVAAVRAGHDSVVEELLAAGANAVLGDSTGHA